MTEAPQVKPFPTHALAAAIACLVIPINVGVWWWMISARANENPGLATFTVLAVMQFAAGGTAVVLGIKHHRATKKGGIASAIFGGMASLGAPVGWFGAIASLAIGSAGGAWGRPLRIRGKQLHPNLKGGADWTGGDEPNPAGLDEATRAALEALWLHDAQKEHASVPAFSRVSWLLASAGAPAELMAWAHRAALEEIDHTRRCFALAKGYAGRSFTVEAMPELLLGGLDAKADPYVTLAIESLADGCQLEDFNADVAARCALVCEEPATRSVLERIAREERSHAELSWAIFEWALKSGGEPVREAARQALADLEQYARPTAVSADKQSSVAKADVAALRRHGRISDAEWAEAWDVRLEATRRRATPLLEGEGRRTQKRPRGEVSAPRLSA
ncbi:MAG: hypothetical protein QM723_06345 [Myxococcaceae bacterium]